jgi:hypothetical protein
MKHYKANKINEEKRSDIHSDIVKEIKHQGFENKIEQELESLLNKLIW